jgi:cytochrome c oxidase subunit IV
MSSHAADLHHDGGHDHPGEAVYIKVAAILTAVTISEVAIYYIHAVRGILVPALIILSVGKFIAVIMYFMHLKFDDKRLLAIFVAAMFITLSVVGALDVLHRFHYIDYASNFLTGRAPETTE